MNWKQATAAAIAAMAAAVAGPASAQLSEGVAAIVNDNVISTYDVRVRAHLLLVSAGIQQTPDMIERARAQALRDLVDERLQMEEAQRFNVTITPDQIDRRIADIAQGNNTTVDALATALTQSGANLGTLRQQIQAEIAWQRIIGGVYGSRVRISETEIRDTQQRLALNAQRPNYLISEIFLPANSPQDFAEMEAGARHLIEEMQGGAPFPLVARQFSAAASAAAGGDMGWLADSELAPELQPVVQRLEPGQVSLPVRTPNGVYIIALRDRRPGVPPGAASLVSLRQISAPAARLAALERVQRRISSCAGLEREIASVEGASVVDLGQAPESELSPTVRERITGIAVGAASPVQVSGDQATTIVVCAREAGGAGVPSRAEIEARLRETELAMLADRYLRNLRREATIITRTQ